jgi:hypothetical protein
MVLSGEPGFSQQSIEILAGKRAPQFFSAADIEFVQDVAHVDLDGGRRDAQGGRDLTVGIAPADPGDYLAFAR